MMRSPRTLAGVLLFTLAACSDTEEFAPPAPQQVLPLATCNRTWQPTGSLAEERYLATATRLPSGTVIVAGGWGNNGLAAGAERYDPATGTWSAAGTLNIPRYWHRAVALNDGRVLVVGGFDSLGSTATAEIYNPATNSWSLAASMSTDRYAPQLTGLADGRVLASGGIGGGSPALATAEIYNPATNTWSPTGSMTSGRFLAVAALIDDGKVLVAGGHNGTDYQSSAELFNPSTGTWSAAPSMATTRYAASAVVLANGKVLVTGGSPDLPGAELFDPLTGTWSLTGNMALVPRFFSETIRLADGRVVVAGGTSTDGPVDGAEIFDPLTAEWSPITSMSTPRYLAASAELLDGRVLVAGGSGPAGLTNSAETYGACPRPACANSWVATGNMAQERHLATATRLTDGTVLAAGGAGAAGPTASAERYNPATGIWSAAGTMSAPRFGHRAVRLQDGKVLVVGGTTDSGTTETAEIYDPAANSWSSAASMSTPRNVPQATALSDGRVLVSGGQGAASQALTSAEVYNPATNTWSSAGSMATGRYLAVIALLADGRVLVAGGHNGVGPQSSAELFNPASPPNNAWSAATPMATARYAGGIAVLANGRVLVAGGSSESPGAEIYDPGSGAWSPTPPMVQIPRYFFETIRLTDGRVVVTGGVGSSGFLDEAELFDPEINQWLPLVSMSTSRYLALSAEVLVGSPPESRILVAGGFGSAGVNNTAETYKPCPPNMRPVALCRNRFVSPACTLPAAMSVDNGSYDPDNGPAPLTLVQAPAGPYPLGTYQVTLTASDGILQGVCSAVVTSVVDPPPEITCPTAAPMECVSGGATVSGPYYAQVVDTDSTCTRSTTTVLCSSPTAGQRLPLGDTIGTCTAPSGASCNFVVSVRDTTPPIPGGSNGMVMWPPNSALQEITLMDCAGHLNDSCGGKLVPLKDHGLITYVTSDEVADAPGGSDGNTPVDIVVKKPWLALLRAERNATLNGRVYTVHYLAGDPSGNMASASCKVSVPTTQNGTAIDSGPASCVDSPYEPAPPAPPANRCLP